MLISARRNTRLIQTPVYNGLFLKFTCLIRTPVNADNGHFSVSRGTNSHTLATPATYGHCRLSTHRLFPCQNHVLIVDIVHCSNNDRFLWV